MAKELHQQGFSVCVPDIAGYCFGTPAQPWTAWVEQAQSQVWELRKHYDTVSVVGVSMGATLAMALEWPLDEAWHINVQWRRRWLDRAITQSPLVFAQRQDSGFLALTRSFK